MSLMVKILSVSVQEKYLRRSHQTRFDLSEVT